MMYRERGGGKAPVAPALLAMVTLLQAYSGASDAEAVDLSMDNARWQMVLGVLGEEEAPFSQGVLSPFRDRLIAHEMDRRLLERTVELARRTGCPWPKLDLTAVDHTSAQIGDVGHGPQGRQRTSNRSRVQRERQPSAEIPQASADRVPISGEVEAKRQRLRRAADVAVVESADLRQRNDLAMRGWLDGPRLRGVFGESQVRTRAVVVAEVIAKTTTQVSLVEDDDVVEEFASDGADHALGEWVLPRRARRGENLGDADTLHASSKLAAVDAVAIAEEEARR